MSRWTEQDLAKFQRNSGRKPAGSVPAKKKRSKFHNKRVREDGILFDSLLELERYRELKLLKAGNQIEWFFVHVPIHCGGGVFYEVDFLIKWRTSLLVEPRITFEDTHGPDTQAKANKLKQIQALWGIEVTLLRDAAGVKAARTG